MRLPVLSALMCCAVAAPALAQPAMTTVVASRIRDFGGNTLSRGIITMSPVNALGQPVSVEGAFTRSVACYIAAGTITTQTNSAGDTNCTVVDAAAADQPFCYAITLYDTLMKASIPTPGQGCVQITGSSWDYDDFIPGGTPVGGGGGGGSLDFSNPMTTLGDIIYGGNTGTPERLAGNSSSTKNFLCGTGTGSAADAPVWCVLASSDIPNNAANTTGTAAGITGNGSSNQVWGMNSGGTAQGWQTLAAAGCANALTMNNSGSGVSSGTTFNCGAAETLSYNTLGAAPAASPTFTGTITIPIHSSTVLGTSSAGALQDNSSLIPTLAASNTFTGSTNTFEGLALAPTAEVALTSSNSNILNLESWNGSSVANNEIYADLNGNIDIAPSSGGTLTFASGQLIVNSAGGHGVSLSVPYNNVALITQVEADPFLIDQNAVASTPANVPVKINSSGLFTETTTTDTGPGVVVGVCTQAVGSGSPADCALAVAGVVTLTLDSGTCSIGQYVVVGTTTNGRAKCTSSLPTASVIGYAMTAQTSVGSTFSVLLTPLAPSAAGSGGTGSVTSVAMTVPSWLAISGSPITSSGTLALTAATGQTANEVLATPNGSSGALSIRALVDADLPGSGATTVNGVSCALGSTCTVAHTNGTVTYTSSQTASTSDEGKLVIMNCSSACSYTLPATQPSTTWTVSIQSIGSSVATIALGGSDTFNSSTVVPVLKSYSPLSVWANSSTSTDYRGSAQSVAGTGITITPASNGQTIALTNNTISGIALGSNLDTLTFGTHLTAGGSSYNGSANVTITSDATNANTASTIVARDSSGNFSAGTVTAALSGNATTATNLSSYPAGCSGGQFSQGLSSLSNNCATPGTRSGIVTFTWDYTAVGSAIPTTLGKVCKYFQYAATIGGYSFIADQSTTSVVKLYMAAFSSSSLPTTDITNSGYISPSAVENYLSSSDSNFTNWTTAIAAGDVLCAQLTTNNNAERITVTLSSN